MKAFKIFLKVFAVLSSIFVVAFFTYNLWDDSVRTGLKEKPGLEWVANSMPEYEDKDRVISNQSPKNDISEIEAEIEREMKEKKQENSTTDTEETTADVKENPETQEEIVEEYTTKDEAELDKETTESEETIATSKEKQDNTQKEENRNSALENNTSNCFNMENGGMTCPKLNEIIYIEADGSKATIYLKERKKYFVSHSLPEVYNQLGTQNAFFKTDQYLINLDHLTGFIPAGTHNSSNRKIDLELIESKEVSIPYSQLDQLKAQYIKTRGIN